MYRGYVCYCVVYWQLYWPDRHKDLALISQLWFGHLFGPCVMLDDVRTVWKTKQKGEGEKRILHSQGTKQASSDATAYPTVHPFVLNYLVWYVILLVALKYYESYLGARVLLVCIVSVPRRWIEWMNRIRWNLFGRRAGEAILPTPVVTTRTVFCSHFQHTTPPTCPKVVWSGSIFHAFSSW